MNLSQVLKRALVASLLVSAAVAVVGGVIGGIVAGGPGVFGAILGALLGLVFFGITTVSVLWGRRFGITGSMGLVAGGWVVKMLVFIVALIALRRAPFLDGRVFFFALVAVSLGTVLSDWMVFMRARLPIFEEPSEPEAAPAPEHTDAGDAADAGEGTSDPARPDQGPDHDIRA
ncbi:MAG: hypothetical protein LKF88_04630 [Microbacteriaceae bacterium]|jgi:hypothetical protein|nr:hypothetical protein [Microbacteriaceae bacterium]MCI1207683.1 hypothetical protein [Microbacteriaceae bacterium]